MQLYKNFGRCINKTKKKKKTEILLNYPLSNKRKIRLLQAINLRTGSMYSKIIGSLPAFNAEIELNDHYILHRLYTNCTKTYHFLSDAVLSTSFFFFFYGEPFSHHFFFYSPFF